MDLSIVAILAQDGITTGAIYALLALALVLVFSVTRVIFIPQGEFVAYGALTLVARQTQKLPAICYLLIVMGVGCFVAELAIVRHPARYHGIGRLLAVLAGKYLVFHLVFPVAVWALTQAVAAQTLPMIAQIALTLLIVVPMGPFVYRLAYEPIAEASTLLLIVAVAVHFAMVGLGLGNVRRGRLAHDRFLGCHVQSRQRVDLRAKPVGGRHGDRADFRAVLLFRPLDLRQGIARDVREPAGARMVGIGTTQAGRLAFTLAAGLGALCGVLVAPITTIY